MFRCVCFSDFCSYLSLCGCCGRDLLMVGGFGGIVHAEQFIFCSRTRRRRVFGPRAAPNVNRQNAARSVRRSRHHKWDRGQRITARALGRVSSFAQNAGVSGCKTVQFGTLLQLVSARPEFLMARVQNRSFWRWISRGGRRSAASCLYGSCGCCSG